MKRVGIVGAGLMAGWHAERWKQLPVELMGFYTPTGERARTAAATYGGRAFGSLDEMFQQVDIVDVCTPTPAHAAPVIAAAAAGKDIVCEKPLARTLRDGQAMIDACSAAGVRLFIAQVVRFFPEFVRAREVLQSGALGRAGVVRSIRGGDFPRPETWYGNFDASGGVILDLAIHDIDYLQWCCGPISRVFARGLTFAGIPATDHALLTLRFAGGVIGHIEGSWAYPAANFRTMLEIAGDGGVLQVDNRATAPMTVVLKQESGATQGAVTIPGGVIAAEDDPYYRELKHFLDCLESGAPFRVAPEDALAALRVALAAIESVRTGRAVDIASWEEAS